MSLCLSVSVSVSLCASVSVCISLCLPVFLSVCISQCLHFSVSVSVFMVSNAFICDEFSRFMEILRLLNFVAHDSDFCKPLY